MICCTCGNLISLQLLSSQKEVLSSCWASIYHYNFGQDDITIWLLHGPIIAQVVISVLRRRTEVQIFYMCAMEGTFVSLCVCVLVCYRFVVRYLLRGF